MRRSAVLSLLFLFLASPAWGDSYLTPAAGAVPSQSSLYDYHTTLELQDDFMGGINSSGNVGNLGWGIAGGTTNYINTEPNRAGIIRRDSGSVSGTLTRMDLVVVTSGAFDPSHPHSVHAEMRLNQIDADTQMRWGSMSASSSITPVNGIYLERLGEDANWFCVTRQASTQTRIDSGVAVDTEFHGSGYIRTSAGVQFVFGGVHVCGLMTTNIPTVALDPAFQLTNGAAASKTYDVDYFEMKITGISR
jgi:hypothetical protein